MVVFPRPALCVVKILLYRPAFFVVFADFMSRSTIIGFLRSFGEVGHDRSLIQPRHDDERSEGDLWMGGVMWRSGWFFVPSEK
jgi:hypothetical protein